jgi:hypothetical protein
MWSQVYGFNHLGPLNICWLVHHILIFCTTCLWINNCFQSALNTRNSKKTTSVDSLVSRLLLLLSSCKGKSTSAGMYFLASKVPCYSINEEKCKSLWVTVGLKDIQNDMVPNDWRDLPKRCRWKRWGDLVQTAAMIFHCYLYNLAICWGYLWGSIKKTWEIINENLLLYSFHDFSLLTPVYIWKNIVLDTIEYPSTEAARKRTKTPTTFFNS